MWGEFWWQMTIGAGLIALVIWLRDRWDRPGCSGNCSRGDEACNCEEKA